MPFALALTFDSHLFLQRLFAPDSTFLHALWTTIYIAVSAQVAGVVFGLVSALARRSRFAAIRSVSYVYVLAIRGTPLIVQIFFTYFGANLFLGFDLFPNSIGLFGLTISGAVLAGAVALAVNEGAYMSEIIRAGIDAIDAGQLEAARCVGMRYRMAMRRIILPQAAKVIVPPLGNEFNGMLKNTALLAFIGVYEIFQDAQVHYSTDFKPVEYFLSTAIWYLLLTMVWTLIQAQIERKLGASDRDVGESWLARLFGIRTGSMAGVR